MKIAIAALMASAVLGIPTSSAAQIPGLNEWADAIAQGVGRRWEGPRVPHPVPAARPDLPVVARSQLRPVSIHASPELDPQRVSATLRAAESAMDLLSAFGWAEPLPDGGLGHTGGFDIYLHSGDQHSGDQLSGDRLSDAYADGPVSWSFLDAVTSWARVDPNIEMDAIEACVASAYVEAALLGQDPAEDARWRRATATYAAWLLTGRYGCDDGLVAQQQQDAWRSVIIGAAGDGAGGALFLTMLSSRNDAKGDGAFVRDLWQLARQRTWDGEELRASPDLWEALDKILEVGEDPLHRVVREFSVARWFTGSAQRERGQPVPALRDLPSDASPPLIETVRWAELSEHTEAMQPAPEPFGSGYALVDVRGAPEGSSLRVWLRGELGVRWALTAIRLGRDGRELSRVAAPARDEPRGYVVVELMDDTEQVLIVGTNLSNRVPDADIPDENVRTFKLIVDR